LKGFFDADADGEKSLNATMVLRGLHLSQSFDAQNTKCWQILVKM